MPRILFTVYCIIYSHFCFSQSFPTFIEEQGIVAIEMESAEDYGDWTPDTLFDGFTGTNYLKYSGPNYFGSPGNSLLTFKIQITTTGTYRFQWRSRIAEGNSNTDHNDNWLRIQDAASFYAQSGTSVLFPHGSGMVPNPNGAGSAGWFKVYQNQLNNWTWDASTSDNDPHPIFIDFDTAGIYTVEISGRSNGHAIDRFVLYHSSVNIGDATWLGRPESPRLNPVNTKELVRNKLKIFPQPATHYLQVQLPNSNTLDSCMVKIYDFNGSLLHSQKTKIMNDRPIRINTAQLPAGNYLLNVITEKHQYNSTFVKI